MQERKSVDELLPLQPAMFHILTALGEGPMHGYAIILDIGARTNGKIKMSAGTLYRSIQRMQEQGLLIESRSRPVPELDDQRRIYYEITPLGSRVIRAELSRLWHLIKLARARGFVPDKA